MVDHYQIVGKENICQVVVKRSNFWNIPYLNQCLPESFLWSQLINIDIFLSKTIKNQTHFP